MPGLLTNKLLQSSIETRIWLVDGGAHIISCRNYTGGAHLEVYLDSELVHSGPNARKKQRRKVALPDQREACVQIRFVQGQSFVYSCTVGDDAVPEDTEGIWDPKTERRPDLDQCVSVPVARLAEATDGDGLEGVVLYKVCVEPRPTDDFARRAEWKRYNDFDELYTLAYSAYFGNQLAANVPKPPGKTLRRRTDAAFIESRRASLESFLQQLLRVPRMGHNPDVLLFLGILDGRCNRVGKTLEAPAAPRRMLATLEGGAAGGAVPLPAEILELLELCVEDSAERPPAEAVARVQAVGAQPEGAEELAEWLATALEGGMEGVGASTHVVVKSLSLLSAVLPKGSAEFRACVKRGRASELLQRAEGYAKGDQGDAMVRGLAQKVGALLLGV